MEGMTVRMRAKPIVILLLASSISLTGQEYKIMLWSFPIVAVKMNSEVPGNITFKTESIGIMDYIWPHDNSYTTHYDSTNFGLRHFSKNIKQGNFKQKLSCDFNRDDSTLIYDDNTVAVPDSVQTIFTLLARITVDSLKYIDTKWFPMDHEGCSYLGRFLWSDTVTVRAMDKDILCDHFRLDLIPNEDNECSLEESDYFMKNIVAENTVRQLWVEKNNNKRIIKAAAKVYGLTLEAIIQDG
jgi:hypothetical protein